MERLGLSTKTVADRPQKLQPAVGAVVVTADTCCNPNVVLKVSLLPWVPNLSTTTDALRVSRAIDSWVLQMREELDSSLSFK